jgi:hypothetical protein
MAWRNEGEGIWLRLQGRQYESTDDFLGNFICCGNTDLARAGGQVLSIQQDV